MKVLKAEGQYSQDRTLVHTVEVERELATVLGDFLSESDGDELGVGVVEETRANSERCAKVIGKLINHLVDNRLMTFDEAKDITGYWMRDIRPIARETPNA